MNVAKSLPKSGVWLCIRKPICPRHPGPQREVVKRRCAAPPHGSFTPTAVLTEPPPLCEAVAGREYHCHSDCHRHAGGKPALAGGILARPGRSGVMAHPAAVAHAFAHRNWCTWRMRVQLSRSIEGISLNSLLQLSRPKTEPLFSRDFLQNF